MSTPYFSYPGTLQGRVQPVAVQATDGTWLMVLGADQENLPVFHLDIGDTMIVEQTLDISGHKLLRFDWRMRYAKDMPAYAKLLDAGPARFFAELTAPANPNSVTYDPVLSDLIFDASTVGALPIGTTVVMVHTASRVRREGLVYATGPSLVKAGDLMGQTTPPSTTAGDYEISAQDSGLVRLYKQPAALEIGGDRLHGVSIENAAPFLPAHAEQLLNITGAASGLNNVTLARISAVPEGQGDVSTFDLLGAGSVPAGRVAVIEENLMQRDPVIDSNPANLGVTVEVLGAQWRAKAEIDTGSGFRTRAELVERLVQADPDGFQRGQMAMHISKVAAVGAVIRFTLTLESVTS